MAKTGRAVAKLMLKSKGNAMKFRMGTHKPMISRTKSPFHEKAIAMEVHRRAIHGLTKIGRNGEPVVVDPGGRNPPPVFDGTGLPDDTLAALKPPKSNYERAQEDKRNSIKSEAREGWRPAAWAPKFMRFVRK